MQDKVHRPHTWELVSLNFSAIVFISQQQFHLLDCQKTAQPLPFVRMSNEETDVDVRGLVARTAMGNIADWSQCCWAKCREVDWIGRSIYRWLLTWICFGDRRVWDGNGITVDMDSMLDSGLLE